MLSKWNENNETTLCTIQKYSLQTLYYTQKSMKYGIYKQWNLITVCWSYLPCSKLYIRTK